MAFGFLMLLALFYRELRVWWFYGNFWPDHYIQMGIRFYEFAVGQLNGSEMLEWQQGNRNGQAFLTPLFVSFWMILGLSGKYAFAINTLLFCGANLVLFVSLVRKLDLWPWLNPLPLLFLFSTNLCVLRVSSSLQPDGMALFFLMLFLYAYVSVINEESGRPFFWTAVTSVAIALGVFCRLALIPLLCVPLAFGLWKWIFDKKCDFRTFAKLAAPGIIAGAIVLSIYGVFGLFESFKMANDFASQAEFLSQFSFKDFSIVVIASIQFGLLAVIGIFNKLRSRDSFVLIVGSALGLLLLLLLGKIAPWLRYGAPLAVLGMLLYLHVVKDWMKHQWQAALAICLIASVNLIPLFYVPNILD